MEAKKFKDSIYYRILKEDLATIKNGVDDLGPHFEESLKFIRAVPGNNADFAYAAGKWSLSEVIGHLLDTRIVFLNRLMYVVRGESVPLLPFDEQLWVENGGYGIMPVGALAAIYEDGSKLIASMVKTLPPGALKRV